MADHSKTVEGFDTKTMLTITIDRLPNRPGEVATASCCGKKDRVWNEIKEAYEKYFKGYNGQSTEEIANKTKTQVKKKTDCTAT